MSDPEWRTVLPQVSSEAWSCQIVGTDGSQYGNTRGRGWLENYGPPLLSGDGRSLITILPTSQGSLGYWPHIVMFRSGQGRSFRNGLVH